MLLIEAPSTIFLSRTFWIKIREIYKKSDITYKISICHLDDVLFIEFLIQKYAFKKKERSKIRTLIFYGSEKCPSPEKSILKLL